MKKILSIFILCLIVGCSLENKQGTILKRMEINDSKCKIEKDIDNHKGFLGDGDYFAKINCSKINLSKNWKKLPLSDSLNQIVQMEQCDADGCKNIYKKFSIPNIKNGYYYFLDRHNESKNKHDDTDLNNRSSWNFTLAILDSDTNTIYYYELDT